MCLKRGKCLSLTPTRQTNRFFMCVFVFVQVERIYDGFGGKTLVFRPAAWRFSSLYYMCMYAIRTQMRYRPDPSVTIDAEFPK